MGLESFTGIWSLNTSNPASTDDVGQGDEHLRGIKESLKRTFPRLSSTANVSAAELSHLSGVGANIAKSLDTLSASLSSIQANVDLVSASLSGAQARLDTISSSLAAEISRGDTVSASLTQVISDVEELSKSVAAADAYGALYIHEASVAFSATTSLQLVTAWDIPGPSNRMTLSTAGGSIVANKAGTYEVACHMSFSASANTVYTMQLMHDAATAGFAADAAIPNNGALANMSFVGIMSATSSAVFTIQMKQSEATDNPLVLRNGQFVVKRLH